MKNIQLRNLTGKGLYIALGLCAAAALTVGGIMIFSPDDDAAVVNKPAEVVIPNEEKPVVMPEDTQAANATSEVVQITDKAEPKTFSTLIVPPVTGNTITSFSMDQLLFSPTMNDWRTHSGIDIAVDQGTKVRACHDGTVKEITDDYWMGTVVIIDHGDGTESVYGNLQSQPTVKVNGSVRAGDIIGSVGNTAKCESAIAPHLHFGVTKDGKYINPAEYLPATK